MKKLLFLLPFFAAVTLLAADPVDVGVTMAAKLIQEKRVTVIDVRTPEEFKEGHISGAKNINVASDDFEARLSSLEKNQPVLVHCKAGGRSSKSLATFKKLGFTNIYHLSGGILDWEDAGQPLEK